MNKHMRMVVAALAVVVAGYTGSAAAQDVYRTTLVSDKGEAINCEVVQGRVDTCSRAYVYTPVTYAGEPVAAVPGRCIATGSGRAYCGRPSAQLAVMEHGDNPVCVEGSTWGIENGNLWVAGHCSAYF